MSKKRLVLFVEGDGDVKAVPILIKRLISEYSAWDKIDLDPDPFKVGDIRKLLATDKKTKTPNWERWIEAASKRRNFGGILLLVDGDCPDISNKPFCVATVAKDLATRAAKISASRYSVGVVFAVQEFETWLIAGINSLSGVELDGGRVGVRPNVQTPTQDIEKSPRDAKGWLSDQMEMGYKPPLDQGPLTNLVEIQFVRDKNLRSFRKLEETLSKMISAIQTNAHIVTP